jgi:hypothetical protein
MYEIPLRALERDANDAKGERRGSAENIPGF